MNCTVVSGDCRSESELLVAAAGPSLDADVGVVERSWPAEEPESKLDALYG